MDSLASGMTERLVNLLQSSPDSSKEKRKESIKNSNPPMDTYQNDPYGQQLIQRCVIVQKDANGYGLTVSGDNPVFVQSVKEDGAAHKAGVQKGDRIIKVNGTLVTQSNHVEVVRLIKSGSYVALTLLGWPPGSNAPPLPPPHSTHKHQPYDPDLEPSEEPSAAKHLPVMPRLSSKSVVSPPKPSTPSTDQEYRNERIQVIKKMLEQEEESCHKIKEAYQSDPSEKLQKELGDSQTRIKVLEQQLRNLTGTSAAFSKLDEEEEGVEVGSSEENIYHQKSPLEQEASDSDGEQISKSLRHKIPWLPQGSQHTRQHSSPDAFFHEPSEVATVAKGSMLRRNRSDAQDLRKELGRYSYHQPNTTAAAVTSADMAAADADLISFASSLSSRRQSMPLDPTGTLQDSDSVGETERSPSPSPSPSASPASSRRQEGSPGQPEYTDNTTKLKQKRSHSSGSLDYMAGGEDVAAVSPHQHTQQANIISMEDEDFQSDDDTLRTTDYGPFKSLDELEKRPAHLAVFLHYLMSNSDPSSLFFYLVTDQYTNGNLKEMKKWAYEIYSTFLAPNAPLRIQTRDSLVETIDNKISMKNNSEDMMRNVFKPVRYDAEREVFEFLADFRQKRTMGLTNIYGEQYLQGDLDKSNEVKIVEQLLSPHLERFTDISENNDRSAALASAVTTFMKQVGCKPQKTDSPLDRLPSFTAKDKKPFMLKSRRVKGDRVYVQGHSFVPTHYQSTTLCNKCNGLLWGIGYQGLQCQNCEQNVHKGQCLDTFSEPCPGKKRKKRRSTIDINAARSSTYLPSSLNTVVQVISKTTSREDPQKDANRGTPSPIIITDNHSSLSANNPTIQPLEKDTEEVAELKESKHVGKMIEKYEEQAVVTKHPGSPGDSPEDGGLSALDGSESPLKSAINLIRTNSLKSTSENKREKRQQTRSKSPEEKQTLHHTKSMDDVDMTAEAVATSISINTAQPVSVSSSSLSVRSIESVASTDTLATSIENEQDSDMEVETDTPNWQQSIDKDMVKKLKPKEIKRQEVINELFHTEKTHVRNLKVLDQVFYTPMLQEGTMAPDLVHTIFPNLREVLDIHSSFNNSMKKEKKTSHVIRDIGDMLLARFEGKAGDELKEASSRFCENQTAALDMLKQKQRKDAKVDRFMTEAEARPECRRLPLKGISSTVFQRLTKYPLLIENLLKYTSAKTNPEEHRKLERTLKCCKSILAHVNQAIKDCENQQRLQDLVLKIDRSALDKSNIQIAQDIKNIDLATRKLLHEGPLTWKMSRNKHLDLHVLLLQDLLVLLQKQESDRYVLKCHSTTMQTVKEDIKNTHSPILKLQNVLCRNVATDKRAFFLVSTSNIGPQIYELVAHSTSERKSWTESIFNAAEEVKKRMQTQRGIIGIRTSSVVTSSFSVGPPRINEADEDKDRSPDPLKRSGEKSSSMDNLNMVRVEEEVQISQPDIINAADEVVVFNHKPSLETIAPVLTPLEKLERLNQAIHDQLVEKSQLMALVLDAPTAGLEEDTVDTTLAGGEGEGQRERSPSSSSRSSRLFEVEETLHKTMGEANNMLRLLSGLLTPDPSRTTAAGGDGGGEKGGDRLGRAGSGGQEQNSHPGGTPEGPGAGGEGGAGPDPGHGEKEGNGVEENKSQASTVSHIVAGTSTALLLIESSKKVHENLALLLENFTEIRRESENLLSKLQPAEAVVVGQENEVHQKSEVEGQEPAEDEGEVVADGEGRSRPNSFISLGSSSANDVDIVDTVVEEESNTIHLISSVDDSVTSMSDELRETIEMTNDPIYC